MGGTPDFLMDTRRGLYSYPALQSRLSENTFAVNGLVDFNNPVLRLGNLSPEDLFVLLGKIRHVFAYGDRDRYLLPDEGIKAFMEHCLTRIGEAYFRTPRNTIKAFIDLLSVLDQNKQVSWKDLVSQVNLDREFNPDLLPTQNGKSDHPAGAEAAEMEDGRSRLFPPISFFFNLLFEHRAGTFLQYWRK